MKIAVSLIKVLKKTNIGLLFEENCSLANVWEEICCQQQEDETIFWPAYVHTIASYVKNELLKFDQDT